MWFCGFFSVYNDGRLGREVSTDPGSFDHLEAISYRGRFHTESCGLRLGHWWRRRRRLDSLYSLTVPCWGHLRSSMDILLRTLVQQLKELYPAPTTASSLPLLATVLLYYFYTSHWARKPLRLRGRQTSLRHTMGPNLLWNRIFSQISV